MTSSATAKARSQGAQVVRHCAKCGSLRVHRSRRRGPWEEVLTALGAAVCRCHDCRCRHAWFGTTPVPLSKGVADASGWGSSAVFTSAFIACVFLVWWFITNYTGLSG